MTLCFLLTETLRGASSPCTAGVCAFSQYALLLVTEGGSRRLMALFHYLSLSPFPCLHVSSLYSAQLPEAAEVQWPAFTGPHAALKATYTNTGPITKDHLSPK